MNLIHSASQKVIILSKFTIMVWVVISHYTLNTWNRLAYTFSKSAKRMDTCKRCIAKGMAFGNEYDNWQGSHGVVHPNIGYSTTHSKTNFRTCSIWIITSIMGVHPNFKTSHRPWTEKPKPAEQQLHGDWNRKIISRIDHTCKKEWKICQTRHM